MNAKDLRVGAAVYHAVFPHWGKGEVVKTRRRDLFGYPVAEKYLVEWSNALGMDGPDVQAHRTVWCRAGDLRKTPNKKKMEMMERLTRDRK